MEMHISNIRVEESDVSDAGGNNSPTASLSSQRAGSQRARGNSGAVSDHQQQPKTPDRQHLQVLRPTFAPTPSPFAKPLDPATGAAAAAASGASEGQSQSQPQHHQYPHHQHHSSSFRTGGGGGGGGSLAASGTGSPTNASPTVRNLTLAISAAAAPLILQHVAQHQQLLSGQPHPLLGPSYMHHHPHHHHHPNMAHHQHNCLHHQFGSGYDSRRFSLQSQSMTAATNTPPVSRVISEVFGAEAVQRFQQQQQALHSQTQQASQRTEMTRRAAARVIVAEILKQQHYHRQNSPSANPGQSAQSQQQQRPRVGSVFSATSEPQAPREVEDDPSPPLLDLVGLEQEQQHSEQNERQQTQNQNQAGASPTSMLQANSNNLQQQSSVGDLNNSTSSGGSGGKLRSPPGSPSLLPTFAPTDVISAAACETFIEKLLAVIYSETGTVTAATNPSPDSPGQLAVEKGLSRVGSRRVSESSLSPSTSAFAAAAGGTVVAASGNTAAGENNNNVNSNSASVSVKNPSPPSGPFFDSGGGGGGGALGAVANEGNAASGVFQHTTRLEDTVAAVEGMRQLNQYLLIMDIASGCQGTVYLGVDTTSNEVRALKEISRPQLNVHSIRSKVETRRQKRRLKQEIEIMRRARHPNLVTLYEVIDDESAPSIWLVMKFIEHGPILTLDSHGFASKTYSIRDVVKYAHQLSSALDYLHARKIVHRDICPNNVLLGQDGVYLADFGVGVLFDQGGSTAAVPQRNLPFSSLPASKQPSRRGSMRNPAAAAGAAVSALAAASAAPSQPDSRRGSQRNLLAARGGGGGISGFPTVASIDGNLAEAAGGGLGFESARFLDRFGGGGTAAFRPPESYLDAMTPQVCHTPEPSAPFSSPAAAGPNPTAASFSAPLLGRQSSESGVGAFNPIGRTRSSSIPNNNNNVNTGNSNNNSNNSSPRTPPSSSQPQQRQPSNESSTAAPSTLGGKDSNNGAPAAAESVTAAEASSPGRKAVNPRDLDKFKQADVFALGLCLYTMLYGQLPYSSGNMADYLDELTSLEPVPIPATAKHDGEAVPRRVLDVLSGMLDKNPTSRMTCSQALEQLRKIDLEMEAEADLAEITDNIALMSTATFPFGSGDSDPGEVLTPDTSTTNHEALLGQAQQPTVANLERNNNNRPRQLNMGSNDDDDDDDQQRKQQQQQGRQHRRGDSNSLDNTSNSAPDSPLSCTATGTASLASPASPPRGPNTNRKHTLVRTASEGPLTACASGVRASIDTTAAMQQSPNDDSPNNSSTSVVVAGKHDERGETMAERAHSSEGQHQ